MIKKRKKFYNDVTGANTRNEYIQRIEVHYKTLKKYMDEFRVYFEYYTYYCTWNKIKIYLILGRERTRDIIKHGEPDIIEIYKLFKYLNLKKDFIIYLINKTNFSYNIYNHIITPIDKSTYRFDIIFKLKMKFAEFIYLILAEYIILHNYMAVGNLRKKCITTIDEFMEIYDAGKLRKKNVKNVKLRKLQK